MFLFLGGMIAVYKIQHQCRAFATDITQNTVELYLKIEEKINFPQPQFSLQVKSPRVQVDLVLNPILCHFQNEKIHIFLFCILIYFQTVLLHHPQIDDPGTVFNMFHFWFCSPILSNIPNHLNFFYHKNLKELVNDFQ